MGKIKTLNDLPQAKEKNNKVLVRVDFNVPMDETTREVTNTARILAAKETIDELLDKGYQVSLCSHLGRPRGEDSKYSLFRIKDVVAEVLGLNIVLVDDCIGAKVKAALFHQKRDEVLLFENLRFRREEESRSNVFAIDLTGNFDYYVFDAFSVAHQDHASVALAAKKIPSFMGRAMEKELEALEKVFGSNPVKPLIAISGGSKVSSKIPVLENLIDKVDILIIVGGMTHTFAYLQGCQNLNTTNSRVEMDMLETAARIMKKADEVGCKVIIPGDCRCARITDGKFDGYTAPFDIAEVPEQGWEIRDAGARSVREIKALLSQGGTLVWNGPLGMFEVPPFDTATYEIAECVSDLTEKGLLVSVAGGGDTYTVLELAGVVDALTYVSLAGGAFMAYLEGKELPGIKALRG